MSELSVGLLVAGGVLFYVVITYTLVKHCLTLDHGGKVRVIPFIFLWPMALIAVICSILGVKRDTNGPRDQATLDDFLMILLMRKLPQTRIHNLIRRARRVNQQRITNAQLYQESEEALEDERRKRRILVRLKAAQVAVRTVETCVEEALADVGEQVAQKIALRVHQHFQDEMKSDIQPIDV